MYNVYDHGDLLEKEAAAFIRSQFSNYERVWQIYIGNTGLAERAPLPCYPYEDKRRSFAEHTYTTLESCFMIHKILESRIFESDINSFDRYIEFNKSFIAFFSYLGRVHDTVIKASNDLKYDNRAFCQRIKEFYEARNIVIHGKKVPIVFDENGLVKMPVLKTVSVKGEAWSDDRNNWSDVKRLPTDYVADNCERYFMELLVLINNEYGHFLDIIHQELKAVPTKLSFVRIEIDPSIGDGNGVRESSGTTRIGTDVYNLKEHFRERRF